MDQFAAYGHALAAMAGYALLMTILAALSVAGRDDGQRTASGAVKRDYANPVYRRGRAFMNAVETAAPFAMATVVAILAGASPFWVNLLASVFLVARVATAVVHIGTTNQTLRSATWAVGMVCVLALGLIGLIAAF